MFWSGYPSLPREAATKLHVTYLDDDPAKVMAEASTCALRMAIPVAHREYAAFKDLMDKSLAYGKIGFGKV